MYYTHHFARHETLERAAAWLRQLGFGPGSIETHTQGIPRLTVALPPMRLPAVEMLIDAVERSDPEGWPGVYDMARQAHVYPESSHALGVPMGSSSPRSAIGWHPFDASSAAAVDQDPVSAAMHRRWGRA